MVRGMFAGGTDYSYQSFDDMVEDLEGWTSGLQETLEKFNSGIDELKQNGYWQIMDPDLQGLFNYSIKFYKTSLEEIAEIITDIKSEVKMNHVLRIKNIGVTAQKLNLRYGQVWHRQGIRKEYSNPNFRMVDWLYGDGRDRAADMIDLSNLAKRLEDFVGRKGASVSSEPLRIHIDEIDSFDKVKTVNPSMVSQFLQDGYLDVSEDDVQKAFEEIVNEASHKKDWGGEIDDLYTANIIVKGRRVATAFMLKGNGLRSKMLQIRDCGKNGDQLLRLFDAPAELFVVQFVGKISEMVIKDVEGKVKFVRSQGHSATYCIINGQDTVRILYAYGKL
jgi:hypothetical protein